MGRAGLQPEQHSHAAGRLPRAYSPPLRHPCLACSSPWYWRSNEADAFRLRPQKIWKDERWKECGIQDLMRPEQIKKKYRRAVLLVHPDKQKDKPPAQALLAERMFEKLKVLCRTFSSLCASPGVFG